MKFTFGAIFYEIFLLFSRKGNKIAIFCKKVKFRLVWSKIAVIVCFQKSQIYSYCAYYIVHFLAFLHIFQKSQISETGFRCILAFLAQIYNGISHQKKEKYLGWYLFFFCDIFSNFTILLKSHIKSKTKRRKYSR